MTRNADPEMERRSVIPIRRSVTGIYFLKEIRMKAWLIFEVDKYYEAVFLIHADTCGKAKAIMRRVWPDLFSPDYKDLRSRRVLALDDRPFTYDNVVDAEIYQTNDDGTLDWINFCSCKLCKGL
jgi:hypothetical protein